MDLVHRALRLLVIIVVVIIGAGFVVPMVTIWMTVGRSPSEPGRYELLPAPWLVPKQAGGTALRLAMIHDVLHERFYLHGPAWFHHRHQQVERELATYDHGAKAKDARFFTLLDDLAVDFDRLGKASEGIPILRRKLDLQQPLGTDGKRPAPEAKFYTTYANLGTLLAHQHLKGALAKDPEALAGLREGLAFIEQSVAVNPDAHFGRERWQMVTLRYLLRASENPKFLTTSDLMGTGWGANNPTPFRGGYPYAVLAQFRDDEAFRQRLVDGPRDHLNADLIERIRESIPLVMTSEREWMDHCGQDLRLPFTFDEPALAFVGIWTLGSGANPHFALALAHLMDGLGQRAIAWNAYERASELAGKFWSDPAVQQELITYCRDRQSVLEGLMKTSDVTLRKQHQAELAYGRAEQAAYQTYEAQQIAAGKNPSDTGFYNDFFHDRPPIASYPGEADTIVRVLPMAGFDLILVLQAVICAILTGLMLLRIFSLKKQLAA